MKIALIDADSIIHIVAYHYAIPPAALEMLEDVSEEVKVEVINEMYASRDNLIVTNHVDDFILDILRTVKATHFIGFVGHREGSHTFRHELATTKPYKGNRKSTPHWTRYWKPIIIEHMVSAWRFIELKGIEADDAIGICSTAYPETDTIVCSPDKDLRQLRGNHYDYKKTEFSYVSEYDALRNLYTQCIVGDSTDNIPGCPGVGEKSKFIEFPGCVSADDFHAYTFEVFKTKGAAALMGEQLQLVYMLRKVDGVDLTSVPKPIEFMDYVENKFDEEDEDCEEDDDQTNLIFTQ
jgi:DNA polymerase-1